MERRARQQVTPTPRIEPWDVAFGRMQFDAFFVLNCIEQIAANAVILARNAVASGRWSVPLDQRDRGEAVCASSADGLISSASATPARRSCIELVPPSRRNAMCLCSANRRMAH